MLFKIILSEAQREYVTSLLEEKQQEEADRGKTGVCAAIDTILEKFDDAVGVANA